MPAQELITLGYLDPEGKCSLTPVELRAIPALHDTWATALDPERHLPRSHLGGQRE